MFNYTTLFMKIRVKFYTSHLTVLNWCEDKGPMYEAAVTPTLRCDILVDLRVP